MPELRPTANPSCLGCLGHWLPSDSSPARNDRVLQSVSLEFRNPLTVGVPYRLEVSHPSIDHPVVKLYDAARLMIKATFTFQPGRADARADRVQGAACLTEATDRKRESFLVGDRVTGTYGPSPDEFEQVIERWGLSAKGATAIHIAAMMWTSFLVGMEFPGRRAIFWRLVLDFKPEDRQQQGPLSYDVTIQDFDERFDLLHTARPSFLG